MKTKIFLRLICHHLLHKPYDLKHVPRVKKNLKIRDLRYYRQMVKKAPLNLNVNAQRFNSFYGRFSHYDSVLFKQFD